MTAKLNLDKLMEMGYVDITGNLPAKDLPDEIDLITSIRPHVKEIIITYDNRSRKARIYITREDFSNHDRN